MDRFARKDGFLKMKNEIKNQNTDADGRLMRCGLAVVIVIGAFVLPLQAQQPPTLETMLGDATYMFNRYDELIAGVNCDGWKAPESLKHTCKDEARLITQNVQSAKSVVTRAAKAKNAELLDLFNVYAELQEISGHLSELSANIPNFADQDGVPYAQAGSKAEVLAANLSNEIRARLVVQQARLEHCRPDK